jgi:ribosomal protein L37AE/L43A
MTTTTTPRAAEIYHCPFCGDVDLRPHSAEAGEWECRSCLRAFTVTLLGMIQPPRGATGPAGSAHGSEIPS